MIKILGEIIKDSRLGNKVIYFNKPKRVIPSTTENNEIRKIAKKLLTPSKKVSK